MADPRTLANLCEARAKTDPRFDTFRGNGPENPVRNYAVLYFPSGSVLPSDRQSGAQSRLGWSFRAVCVGLGSDDHCLYVVNLLRPLFQGWSPVSDGGATSWLEEGNDDPPLLRSEVSPGDVRFSNTLRYTLTTTRS